MIRFLLPWWWLKRAGVFARRQLQDCVDLSRRGQISQVTVMAR